MGESVSAWALLWSEYLSNRLTIMQVITFSKDDVYISYLPLAHVFERLMAVSMYFEGARYSKLL